MKHSIVVPCLNERHTIIGLLDAIQAQSVGTGQLEVLIVDGGSTDGTIEQVQAYAEKHPSLRLRLIHNPKRSIPAALNLGIQAAAGDTIVRLDAHSEPAPDYLAQIERVTAEQSAANVGGRWDIRPGASGWIANSIAVAGGHLLGAGDARYRISGEAGPVDTVPFGAFDRDWLAKVGPFNEALLTNEDYEMNTRIRQAGGVIWFDPMIQSVYFARSTWPALLRQYARYGFWKAKMIRTYPKSIRWRQIVPPAFVAATALMILGSVLSRWSAIGLAILWAGYGLLLLGAALAEAIRRGEFSLVVGLPISLTIMHLAWGSGFVAGLLLPASSRSEPIASETGDDGNG